MMTLSFWKSLLVIIDIFYLLGEPVLLYLLRCKGFAVDDHSFMLYASHLEQPRLVNNLGK